MTNNIPDQTNPWGFEALTNKLYEFADSLEGKRKTSYGIAWLIIAIILIVVASLPLGEGLRIVSVIVGWPAGVILFALILSTIHSTKLHDLEIFRYKEVAPPKKRVSAVVIGLVFVAALLIATAAYVPVGLGGTIMILSALAAYNIIRRTKEELALAAAGLPDPRELPDDEDEEE